jgi:predicted TIM-barrel fold metal-dependent hydrolase
MKLIQIHSHIFTSKNISEGFLGFKLPFTYSFLHAIEGSLWLMSTVGRLFGKKKLSNYKNFVDCFNDIKTSSIYKKLKSYDKEPTIHCALIMDTISIDGEIKEDIYTQILEHGLIKANNKDFIFFVAIDPSRPIEEIQELLELSKNAGASGYKMYPSLGYLPSHPNLMNIIYPFCLKNKWAITAHCSSAITRASAKRLHIIGLDLHDEPIDEIRRMRNKEDYRQLNDPIGYVPVLRKYPDLHINFAHFGGEEIEKMNKKPSWCDTILMLMSQYEGVYTDISYSFSNKKQLLKVVQLLSSVKLYRERCLLGTDFYMVLLEGDYGEMMRNLFVALGFTNINKIGRENPRKFLYL